MDYPVSETFLSFQGEGIYAGTMMYFIRLAGCTVGKRYPKEMYEMKEVVTPQVVNAGEVVQHKDFLPVYTEKCTLYDGREFSCDTDYRKHERLNEEELIARIPQNVYRVCITGGEPTMHDLKPLAEAILLSGRKMHLETSGTHPLQEYLEVNSNVWITVSPKFRLRSDFVRIADEFKFLVDLDFNPEYSFALYDDDGNKRKDEISVLEIAYKAPSFLQPVNYENEVNAKNLKLCVDLQIKYPVFRLSPQLHKVVSHYLKETIR